jgi:hypothetical protein
VHVLLLSFYLEMAILLVALALIADNSVDLTQILLLLLEEALPAETMLLHLLLEFFPISLLSLAIPLSILLEVCDAGRSDGLLQRWQQYPFSMHRSIYLLQCKTAQQTSAKDHSHGLSLVEFAVYHLFSPLQHPLSAVKALNKAALVDLLGGCQLTVALNAPVRPLSRVPLPDLLRLFDRLLLSHEGSDLLGLKVQVADAMRPILLEAAFVGNSAVMVIPAPPSLLLARPKLALIAHSLSPAVVEVVGELSTVEHPFFRVELDAETFPTQFHDSPREDLAASFENLQKAVILHDVISVFSRANGELIILTTAEREVMSIYLGRFLR